jgi:Flp pilus assembly protein CpaB
MTYRLRNIILAVVLAVLAAFLTALYVANYQHRVDQGQEKVTVYVAKTDIPPGTPAASLSTKVTQKEIIQKNAIPVAVYDLKDVKGQTTSQWIYSGEQITARRFNATGRSGIHAQLKGNMRAIALPGDEQQLLAGTLKTGDHVDVVAHFGPAARILLRDIEVLKAPAARTIDSKISSGTDGAFSVILKVTDSQAHKLFFVSSPEAAGDFDWWLDLRAPADATDSPESVTTIVSAVRDGLPANQLGRVGGVRNENR